MKTSQQLFCFIINMLLLNTPLQADIITDGTLGQTSALVGPNYLINDKLGQQLGGNLFHSFQTFNLNSGESATFTGPNSVNNIISRVTGGNPSKIDGLLRSTIPNADVYFLNPYGIMFGENARLDVQGSFHASTADYLRLGKDGRFDVRQPSNSLLTVAPVEAFGFLTNTPAPITIQESTLSVSEGKTLSFIGGELQMNSPEPIFNEKGKKIFSLRLAAEFGRINLASLASPGEVMLTESGLNLTEHVKRGPITINNAEMAVSGEGGGYIFIRGGRVELTNSGIDGRSLGNQDSGIIDIRVDELELRLGAAITTNTLGIGQGGTITIFVTEALTLSGVDEAGLVSRINNNSKSTEANAGDAGSIDIEARQLTLKDGAQINSVTHGPGEGSTITIKVSETFMASGIAERGYSSGVSTDSLSEKANGGNAGNIDIEARQLLLSDGAQIGSVTFGGGESGTVVIVVTDTLTLLGVSEGFGSGIFVNSQNEKEHYAGDGGSLNIEARQITITEGGVIASATFGAGKGGTIAIKTESMTLSTPYETGENSGIFAISESELANAGDAGRIDIEAHQIQLTDGAVISNTTSGYGEGNSINIFVTDNITVSGKMVNEYGYGITSQSESMEANAGNAGNISIQANAINLTNGGEISTSATNATGGNITLTTPNLLLQEGQIITNVQGGSGDGGNITIENPRLFTLDNSQLLANAKRGRGGNIDVRATQLRPLGDSVIDASSELGLNGRLFINDIDISNNVIPLSINYLAAETLLPTRCAERLGTNLSRFIVTGPEILPESPSALSVHIPAQLLDSLNDKPNDDSNTSALNSQISQLFMGCR
jgi:filamentous hemagglutinin family protein